MDLEAYTTVSYSMHTNWEKPVGGKYHLVMKLYYILYRFTAYNSSKGRKMQLNSETKYIPKAKETVQENLFQNMDRILSSQADPIHATHYT